MKDVQSFLKELYKTCDGSESGDKICARTIRKSTNENIKDVNSEDFEFMNEVENSVDIKRLTPAVMVELLFWSFKWWDNVPAHSKLYLKVKRELKSRKFSKENIDKLLSDVKDGELYWLNWENELFSKEMRNNNFEDF